MWDILLGVVVAVALFGLVIALAGAELSRPR